MHTVTLITTTNNFGISFASQRCWRSRNVSYALQLNIFFYTKPSSDFKRWFDCVQTSFHGVIHDLGAESSSPQRAHRVNWLSRGQTATYIAWYACSAWITLKSLITWTRTPSSERTPAHCCRTIALFLGADRITMQNIFHEWKEQLFVHTAGNYFISRPWFLASMSVKQGKLAV